MRFGSAIKARYESTGFIRKLLGKKSKVAKSLTQRTSTYDIHMSARDRKGLTPVEVSIKSTNLIMAGFDDTSFFEELFRNPPFGYLKF
jgi:hypothetical protein